MIATAIRAQFTETGQQEIVLTLDGRHEIVDLKNAIAKGKKLLVEIKPHRKHRSLDANAYMWVMLDKIAQAVRTDKDAVYLTMLERYGVFTHVIVKPEAVDRMISEWRTVRNLGPIMIGGQRGVQLQCYFGSSTYDTTEMARLIDGVVQECKELGIETLPDDEVAKMSLEWGR